MSYMRIRTWIAPDARGPDLGKRKRQRPTDMLARDAQAVAEGAAQLRARKHEAAVMLSASSAIVA